MYAARTPSDALLDSARTSLPLPFMGVEQPHRVSTVPGQMLTTASVGQSTVGDTAPAASSAAGSERLLMDSLRLQGQLAQQTQDMQAFLQREMAKLQALQAPHSTHLAMPAPDAFCNPPSHYSYPSPEPYRVPTVSFATYPSLATAPALAPTPDEVQRRLVSPVWEAQEQEPAHAAIILSPTPDQPPPQPPVEVPAPQEGPCTSDVLRALQRALTDPLFADDVLVLAQQLSVADRGPLLDTIARFAPHLEPKEVHLTWRSLLQQYVESTRDPGVSNPFTPPPLCQAEEASCAALDNLPPSDSGFEYELACDSLPPTPPAGPAAAPPAVSNEMTSPADFTRMLSDMKHFIDNPLTEESATRMAALRRNAEDAAAHARGAP
eukprot:TRINITY_DN10758_c0_g1_i1.p1 TRINITY_DN10758_c0_g1~~TRINITY_DN10758_c0_g1_i1.p1  ORF type:complete len:379 (+),score=84.37 TRINITY_DN10758_c0_g1_i1:72-1208(+)